MDEVAEARRQRAGDQETPVTLNMFPSTPVPQGTQQEPAVPVAPYPMQMPGFMYATPGSFGWTPFHGVPGYHPVGCYPVVGYQTDGAQGNTTQMSRPSGPGQPGQSGAFPRSKQQPNPGEPGRREEQHESEQTSRTRDCSRKQTSDYPPSPEAAGPWEARSEGREFPREGASRPRRTVFDRIRGHVSTRLGRRRPPSQRDEIIPPDEDEVHSSSGAGEYNVRPSNVDRIQDIVKREVERLHRGTSSRSEAQLLVNPFVESIMSVEYPTDLRLPNIKAYLGKTDLESHVNIYYGSMIMMGLSDAVICRAFFSTLGGRTAEWFKTLEPGSIENFHQLSAQFTKRFAVHRSQKRHFTHLNTLKQREEEALTRYLERWSSEFGDVEPVDDKTAINTLHNSLRPGRLYESFFTDPPSTYQEAMTRALNHARAEEAS